MDPNQTLKDLRAAVTDYNMYERDSDPNGMGIAADDIVQYIEALDTWLSEGGFWPSAWKKG